MDGTCRPLINLLNEVTEHQADGYEHGMFVRLPQRHGELITDS